VGAALAYVLRQWSVRVSRLDAPSGDTGYVSVGFPVDTLSPELAQAFFQHAGSVSEGLGANYSALDDTMIFFNLRDADGAPLGGLDDMEFAARLGQAAGSFQLAQVKIVRAGFAEASALENDWGAYPRGEQLAGVIDDPVLLRKLDPLRDEHDALVNSFARRYDWP
jgi:hypothetical protein